MQLVMAAIGVRQKQPMVEKNLDEITSAVGPTGWIKKSTPDIPFRLH